MGVDPDSSMYARVPESSPCCWIACCRFNTKGKCQLSRTPRSLSCARAYYDEINQRR